MSSCLGLYIENNIIKYAKVTKDHDELKVESYGVKFYENLTKAIDQVVEETYSQRTPISINLSEEMYNYFQMYALLSKSDLQKAIKTEFESYCANKGYNPNVFETRYAIADNQLDEEKLRIIHIADNKIELNKRIQLFSGYHLTTVSPLSMSIPNLAPIGENDNCIIINMEAKTEIITIIKGKVYNIETLDDGSQTILDKINLKENSYSKAYEICKNTTIYTSEGQDLQSNEDGYLADIMPTLYNIVTQARKTINNSIDKIKKVYITGTASLINNADLYFQEYLGGIPCEMLRPYFTDGITGVNIKDYIEVNSAISLALMGLNEGISGMNFKKKTFADSVPDWLKLDFGSNKTRSQRKNSGGLLTWDLGQGIDKVERNLLRLAAALLIIICVYSAFAIVLSNQMDKKENEAENSIAQTTSQIQLANSDDDKIKTKTNDYSTLIKNLEDANDKIADANKSKNAIPNLLNQLMSVIPETVQLTSIENTADNNVVINAQSDKYEQLGFFVAKLKNDVILTNVVSTAGQKDNGVVTIKIEGKLP